MPLQNEPNKAKFSFHMSRIVLAMADLPRHSMAMASAFRHSRSVAIKNLRFKIKNSPGLRKVTLSNGKYRLTIRSCQIPAFQDMRWPTSSLVRDSLSAKLSPQ